MTKKPKYRKYWNFKTFVLAFQIAFIVCFFLSIFDHAVRIEIYNDQSHLYVSRGYPIPWAGVSVKDKKIPFPIIAAPFGRVDDEWSNVLLVKVIDLSVFVPFFLSVLIIFYILFLPFILFFENKSQFKGMLIFVYCLLSLCCLFIYYFWFPRI